MSIDPILDNESRLRNWRDDLEQSLDVLNKRLRASIEIDRSMHAMKRVLARCTMALSTEEVTQKVMPQLVGHPVYPLLLEDPFTRRSYEKPRGFAGDAGLIDFFHGMRGPGVGDTPLGAALFSHNMADPSCDAVRARRAYFAQQIDRAAELFAGKAKVFSVACGHLREAAFSHALSEDRIAQFIALDQDTKALETIERDYGHLNVDITNGSVAKLIGGAYAYDDCHLIYASGLYDYLEARTARRLTENLAAMLAPGGRLILPNFKAGIPEQGYMTAVMHWSLIYRDEDDMRAMIAGLDRQEFATRLFTDPYGAIIYMEIDRAA